MIPRISVLLWVGERGNDVAGCLAGLGAGGPQTPSYEVLVAGGDEAAGVPVAAHVRRVALGERDVGTGWNLAAAAATGDLLLFLRADTLPLPDLLARHAALHDGPQVIVGLGTVEPAPGSHRLASVRRRLDPWLFTSGLVEFVGSTLSVPAAAFRSAGAFATGLSWGHEIDLVHRLRECGGELRLIDGAAGRRARAVTGAEAAEERRTAGRGSAELYARTPSLLPELELGGFHAGEPSALWLRRALLRLGSVPFPPALGALLPPGWWRERWTRFQHEYHYWRGVREVIGAGPRWQALCRPPVILMYHAIGAPGEPAGCYIVPRARFVRQLRWLALRRYRILGLEELLRHRRAHELPPARSVVITFDDGYADNRALAAEPLLAHRFTATFFLVSGCIGGRNSWDASGELSGRPILTWQDVHALREAGMELGAHTRSHPVLPELTPDRAASEIAGSREDLSAALGDPVRTFAYPFGRVDEATAAAVVHAGFEAACSSRSGVNDPAVPAYLLRRVEVRGTDSMLRFAMGVHRGWGFRRRWR